jgi:arylsulfatase A-like enzyme
MDTKRKTTESITIAILLLFCATHAMGAETRPNVILIFVDDLGYCDSELYGCDIPTPNLKQLADEGTLFTAGYVTSPVCSPSRAGLLTGRSQQRFGHEFLPEGAPNEDGGLPISEPTLADAMRQAGYVTGMVGKWHLGEQAQFHPINRGFDEFFGIITGFTDYIDPTRTDVVSLRRAPKSIAPTSKNVQQTQETGWSGRGPNTVMRGTTPVEEHEYLTDAFTRESVAFINKHKEQPFFLYLPYTVPHSPWQVTRKYYDRFPHIKDEPTRVKRAMVSALDDGIGVIQKTLQENGLEENTLVVFLSDNGAGAGGTDNTPLRLGKHTLFEGGIRVPFSMKWPAKIPAGVTYKHPVSALDIFPTAVAAGGGELPDDKEMDGVDLLPFLNGSASEPPHEQLYWRNGPNWAIRDENWKLTYAAKRYWLYDLSNDIGERTNLAEKHPGIVHSLSAKYQTWNSGNIEPAWPPLGAKTQTAVSVDGVPVHWVF